MHTVQVTVAVVEDDDRVRRGLERMLAAAGFRTAHYSSAEAFLDDTTVQWPDCLVLDIQLSGMSGFELQRHLAQNGVTVPIIFITAFEELVVSELIESENVVALLRKPFVGSALLAAVRDAVDAS